MAKKKSWLDRAKKYFGFDTNRKKDKEKRIAWLFKMFRSKHTSTLTAPTPIKAKTLEEAEEEQSKHALAVAVATAAAAEAAIAAAHAAVQVVRLSEMPSSRKKSREDAAIRIQTVFRGYLARRALRALKSLVRLQALVRGQAVRRQTGTTLRSLQSLMRIQSQAHSSRTKIVQNNQACCCNKDGGMKTMLFNPQSKRSCNGSILSKEEIETILKSQIEDAFRRERVLKYASFYQKGRRNQQKPTALVDDEMVSGAIKGRWLWPEECVDIPEVPPGHSHDTELHVSDCSKDRTTAEVLQPGSLPRRSFSQPRWTSEDSCTCSTATTPGYMAFTASTRAKFRSLSTPRQRMGMADTRSECCIRCTHRPLSPMNSKASDAGHSNKASKSLTPCKNSPRIKAQIPVIKSRRSPTRISFDSECSFSSLLADSTGI